MKKLVWAEGILLGQQHLQQWDHYHHDRQDFLSRALSPFVWGVKKLIWDEEGIQHGKCILKYAEIIFPNNQLIKYDSRFELPLSYDLTHILDITESIYLAIPISCFTKGITGYPEHAGLSGWIGEHQIIFDDEDAEREREVLFAYPNLQLLSSHEDKNLYYHLKIAEITRNNMNQYDFSADFIPSCIYLDSSDGLKILLNTYIDLITAKISLLKSRHTHSHAEWRDFLLLQQLNIFLPQLFFLKSTPQQHPLEFYKLLIKLLGVLTSFSTENFMIPPYDHPNLTAVFYELDKQLKLLLTHIIPSRMTALKWRRESDWLYTTELIDSRIFQKNRFYLAVSLDAPILEWLSLFVYQVKVGARSVIESIVASALTGVSLVHVQRPPNKLPIKAGYEYFYIEPVGLFWEQILSEKNLALFVSEDFIKARIELLAIEITEEG